MSISQANIHKQIRHFTHTHFLPVVNEKIHKYAEVITGVDEAIQGHFSTMTQIVEKKPFDHTRLLNNAKLLKSEVFELIENNPGKDQPLSFDEEYKAFVDHITDFCQSIPERVTEIQHPDRFKPLSTDKRRIRLSKRVKKLLHNLSQWPIVLANGFRKIFRKKTLPEKKWRHTIAFRNLAQSYFRESYCLNLLKVIDESNRFICGFLLDTWRVEELVDKHLPNLFENEETELPALLQLLREDHHKKFDQLHERIDAFKTALPDKTDDFLATCNRDFLESFSKAGTIELSNRRFSDKIVIKGHHQLQQQYLRFAQRWDNTFYALFEDWRLNNELFTLKYQASENYYRLNNKCFDRIHLTIKPQIARIGERLKQTKCNIDNFKGKDEKAMTELIDKERSGLEAGIGGALIPETVELILEQQLPDQVSRMENRVREHMAGLSKKRAIVQTTEFDKPLKSSEIEHISPHELINFEVLPRFLDSTQKVKQYIVENVDGVQAGLSDLLQVALFNLESAKSIYEQAEEKEKDASTIASEGISRAINKMAEIEAKLDSIRENIKIELGRSVKQLNNGLMDLTSTENVFDIRLRIAKAKALGKSKAFRKKIVENSIRLWATGREQFIKNARELGNSYNMLLKKYGLAAESEPISSELSDFLGETDQAIDKLPYVYQRLFKIAPLEDKSFVEGHEREILELNNAYNNWLRGRFAPTIITGENGSGKSTLINMFLYELERNFLVKRYQCPAKLYNQQHLVDFMKQIFNNDEFTCIEDVIDFLSNSQRKQLVIVEDIQHMFLKKVDGFSGLKLLFELISKTNQKVFWMLSVTYYAWNYLDKTLNMADHFGYVIKVQELEDEQIINMILKRHRVSGYNVFFQPEAEDLRNKIYKKLPESEKQEYLKKQYFSSLNKFAKDNISLALLFWLRSTIDIKNNTIVMGNLNKLDFSFLNSLTMEKIFVLHALVLHDGLSADDLALVQNQSPDKTRLILLLMVDDGILSKEGDLYIINPLLHRHIISLLKSKNLLH